MRACQGKLWLWKLQITLMADLNSCTGKTEFKTISKTTLV